jgi:cell pole-organizing protein PopZ
METLSLEADGLGRTNMSNAKTPQEPSMEEILASIRRIISEDSDADAQTDTSPPPATAPRAMDEDVLELTQMVQDDGSVVTVQEPPADPTHLDSLEPHSMPMTDIAAVEDSDALLSRDRAAAASASFAQLAGKVGGERPGRPLHPGQGRTLEDLVKELIRPMLREWLDRNLPPMVERMVRSEIEKLVHSARSH